MEKNIVIIPTYNEKENIEAIIDTVLGLGTGLHVLVVEDNSPDGTAQIVEQVIARHPGQVHMLQRAGKQGLGTAYIAGFRWALEQGYDHIIEMDADFSHDPADLPRLLAACHNGADVAVGSRYASGVNVVNWPMQRVLISYYASAYVRAITRMKIRDTTAGFVCYKRKVLETIDLNRIRFKGYAFQIEMKFTSIMHGFKVDEVPIIFTERKQGQSKMTRGIITEAVFGVIRLKIGSWFRKYPQA